MVVFWNVDENEMELKKRKAAGKKETPSLFNVCEYLHDLFKHFMWIIQSDIESVGPFVCS